MWNGVADRPLLQLIEPLEPRALLSSGALDPAFGNNGIRMGASAGTASPSASGEIAMALQQDGSILLASRITAADVDCQLVRYRPDGTRDKSFGTQGRVRFNYDGVDIPADLALQADGKILILINSTAADFSSSSSRLLRLLPGGRPDTSFASNGALELDHATHWRHITTAEKGAILLDDGDGTTRRINSSGSTDLSFGIGGQITLPVPQALDVSEGGIILTESVERLSPRLRSPDNRLIGISQFDFIAQDANGAMEWNVHQLSIWRYTSTGKPDSSFGDDGVVTLDMGGATQLDISTVNLVEAALHRRADLPDSLGLFVARRRDLRHQAVDLGRRRGDLFQHRRHLGADGDAIARAVD